MRSMLVVPPYEANEAELSLLAVLEDVLRPNARQSSDTQRSDPGSRQRERRTALSMSPSGRLPPARDRQRHRDHGNCQGLIFSL